LLNHLSLTFHPGFQGVDGLENLPRPGSTGWRIATRLAVHENTSKGTGRTLTQVTAGTVAPKVGRSGLFSKDQPGDAAITLPLALLLP
jgi:hypothetical protein